VFVAFVFVALMAALVALMAALVALMAAFAGSLYYIVYMSHPRVYVYVHFLNHFIFAK